MNQTSQYKIVDILMLGGVVGGCTLLQVSSHLYVASWYIAPRIWPPV